MACGDGYVVLDNSRRGKLHWLDQHGNIIATYEDSLTYPWHAVDVGQGRLIVADTLGNQLHLHVIGPDRKLSQYLLTQEDGIKCPTCLYLDETTSRLFVGHDDGKEIRMYNIPRHLLTR